MRKITFEKDIRAEDLYQLITSHAIHGFFYTVISRNTFSKISSIDLSINVSDQRDAGLGYVWYSYSNMIYLVTDDNLKDNQLIYLKEEDLKNLVRNKKINLLKDKIKN